MNTTWWDGRDRVNDAWIELRFKRAPLNAQPVPNSKGAIEWIFDRPLFPVPLRTFGNEPALPVLFLDEADSFEFCGQ